MGIGSVVTDITSRIEKIGKEIWTALKGGGELFLKLAKSGKLIEVGEDGEAIASAGAKAIITFIDDGEALVTTVAKDDGASLAALKTLAEEVTAAVAAKGENWVEDVASFTDLIAALKTFSATNYTDVITSFDKVVTDVKSVSTALKTDVEKLIKDTE